MPSPSFNRIRNGMHREPGMRNNVYHHGPGLQNPPCGQFSSNVRRRNQPYMLRSSLNYLSPRNWRS